MIVTRHDYDTPTYIVCGTPFSGSSLVAGTLRHLGVYMGEEFTHEGTHQDVELSLLRTGNQRLATVRNRNATYFEWGFKSVNMQSWLPALLPFIRNPVFLFCSRGLADTLAETCSLYSRGDREDIAAHLAEEAFLCNFFLTHAVPWCLLKFGEEPEDLLEQILSFTGLCPTEAQKENALAFNDPEIGYAEISHLPDGITVPR